ncbi:MAG TPA: FliH/SctL family protein [Candidatus Baltobacteraceae bacterium]|jgi:flagellar biosynthesis/type III secretory pathway protein FliH|nr:FliH/SctL family protein [Candidatus Baltobacteraceae bacterium]
MPDRFVPLHDFVFPASIEPDVDFSEPIVEQVDETQVQTREQFAEIRRFGAAVRDAVDVAVSTLLCDVAAEVLARELELSPANVDSIVSRACARYASEKVVRVRAHPDEAAEVAYSGVDVVADSALRRGDVVLEVRTGTIDVTLGARLADVLDRAPS